jgi:hypothetical protein
LATNMPKAGSAAPQGNEFTYYVPKSVAPAAPSGVASVAGPAAAVAPRKPTPTLTLPVGGGKGAYLNPRDFIESNFVKTSNANFGTKAKLGGTHQVIRRIDVVRAALEAGYGRRSGWSSSLVLDKAEALDLARYLMQRLQMVVVCLTQDNNKAHQPRSFYDRVEASEKTALSFILGGIGAYLAAHRWLVGGGDSVRSFLHVGIFTKGIASASAAPPFSTTSTKSPDYLVEGLSGGWHVFESKGGGASSRWARLCQGLAQLDRVPSIGWAGKATKSALTCVCVHTSVDPGRVLRVTAVDPPPDGDVVDGGAPFVLIEGVCRLLQMLETLEQYRVLAERPQLDGLPVHEGSWQLARTSSFGQLLVGIPVRYLQREDEVRQRLAVFFAIREVLESRNGAGNAADDFVGEVTAWVQQATPSDMPLDGWSFQLGEVLRELAPHVQAEDFLFRCSKALLLEQRAAELMPAPSQDIERLLLYLVQPGEYVVTSGGLFVQGAEEASQNVEG